MSLRLPTASLAVAAAAILALLPVSAAIAAEQDQASHGIEISVVITPLQACIGACSGAGAGRDLPATGGSFPTLLIWLAAALLTAGLAIAVWHRLRPAGVGWRIGERSNPYADVNGRRAMSTDAELATRADRSAALGEDSGPDGERGDPQCPRT